MSPWERLLEDPSGLIAIGTAEPHTDNRGMLAVSRLKGMFGRF